MFKKLSTSALSAAVIVAAGAAALTPTSASAVSSPLSGARTAVHFDLAKGQTPENIALAPGGSAYVTFAESRQIAEVSPRAPSGSWPPCPSPLTGASTPRSWDSR